METEQDAIPTLQPVSQETGQSAAEACQPVAGPSVMPPAITLSAGLLGPAVSQALVNELTGEVASNLLNRLNGHVEDKLWQRGLRV